MTFSNVSERNPEIFNDKNFEQQRKLARLSLFPSFLLPLCSGAGRPFSPLTQQVEPFQMYCFNLASLCYHSSLFSSISSFHLPPTTTPLSPLHPSSQGCLKNVVQHLYFNPLVRIVLLSSHSPAPLSPPATRLLYLFFSSASDNQLDLVRRWVKPFSNFTIIPSRCVWVCQVDVFFPLGASSAFFISSAQFVFSPSSVFIMCIYRITLYLPPFFWLFSSVNFFYPFVPRIQSLSPSSNTGRIVTVYAVWIYSIVSVHIR